MTEEVVSKSVYEVGRPATFFWREETHGKHIESAAVKIIARLGERYDLNQFLIDNLTTEIEQRLKRAERGKLRPILEVRKIVGQGAGKIFEIKWDNLTVSHKDPVTGLYEQELVFVRLYYYQSKNALSHINLWGVGLWVHEKEIVPGNDEETRRLQNKEISKAAEYHSDHFEQRWNVSELQHDQQENGDLKWQMA